MQKYTASNPITGNSSYSFVDQEEADLRLKYLDDNGCNYCKNCYNCKNCNYCNNCDNCTDCTDCNNCNYCKNCNYCTACKNCNYCTDCNNCNNCTDCYNCKNCTACNNCKNCYDCKNCNNCTDCDYCKNCYDCKNCTACYDCNDCNNCTNVQSSQDYLILGPAQSSRRMTYAYIDSKLKSLVISCGCFKGSPDEFKAIISKTHKDSPICLAQYNAFAACIEASLSHRISE